MLARRFLKGQRFGQEKRGNKEKKKTNTVIYSKSNLCERTDTMLTFEEKKAIIDTFPQLTEKGVSLKRVNYHFEQSLYDKTIVVYHLHPNGNGFVFVGDLPGYDSNEKGLVNIRDFSESDLRAIIADSIRYLSDKPEDEEIEQEEIVKETTWRNREGQTLVLANEDELWNVYTGLNLEESFESFKEAERYLLEEGFRPQSS